MKFVIDLNVLLSAAFFQNSTPHQAFEGARQSGTLLTSRSVLAELVAVINRPKFGKYLTVADKNAFLQKYILLSRQVKIEHTVTACRDSKDNKYSALALSGQANCLITGDEDLLILHPFENIPIFSPADFLSSFV